MQCFVGVNVAVPLFAGAGARTFVGARPGASCFTPQRRFAAPARIAARDVSHTRTRTPRMGLIPFVPNWLALGSYAYGAYRFWRGFRRTDYVGAYRIPLTLLFPLFLIVNKNFRSNFFRAVTDDGSGGY